MVRAVRLVDRADGDDATVAHADVRGHRRRSGAVDDAATGNDEIEHVDSSQPWSAVATASSTAVPAKNPGLPRV